MINVLGLSLYGSNAASHRVRLAQFKPGLHNLGVNLEVHSLINNKILFSTFRRSRPPLSDLFMAYIHHIFLLLNSRKFDLAIVHVDLLPFVPSLIELSLLQIPFIYDFDDAFYLKYRSGRYSVLQPLLGDKADRLMAKAAAITAGNYELYSYAKHYNINVTLLPSVVDTDSYFPRDLFSVNQLDKTFTIGWIGSPSTAKYLDLLIWPLRQLALEIPLRFVVIGSLSFPSIPGVDVVLHSWSLHEEVSLIQQFDVGVMPLTDSPWARGKCAYKLIQYMSCGIPVVASRVGANIAAVPSDCGILVDSSYEWLESLRRLFLDSELRVSLGMNASNWVRKNYSLSSALPVLSNLIKQVHSIS